MAYTTQQELVDRYGADLLVDLTDRADPPAGAIDAGTVALAIADAQALIDGYLKQRYSLPLGEVPDLVSKLARELAIHGLHTYEPNDKIRRDHEAALVTLRDIARGVIALDLQGATPAESGGGAAQVTDRERPFTAKKMSGFI